jgi:hypothetical protein
MRLTVVATTNYQCDDNTILPQGTIPVNVQLSILGYSITLFVDKNIVMLSTFYN